ncbi:hypothetical protein DITRI_Ditri16bG0154900 [Diplodiscus trichospermus]
MEASSEEKAEFDEAEIEYVSYGGEHHLPLIMNLVDQELSEPYSIFTYRYFVYLWPQLSFLVISYFPFFPFCFRILFLLFYNGFHPKFLFFPPFKPIIEKNKQAFHNGKCVGTVVCKMGEHRNTFRGYIAMLVVIKPYRGRGIATELVTRSIRMMMESGCEEVTLEAEVTNKGALALYGRLGFIRAKRLYHYYLNGVDAFRLKLLFPRQELQHSVLTMTNREESNEHTH